MRAKLQAYNQNKAQNIYSISILIKEKSLTSKKEIFDNNEPDELILNSINPKKKKILLVDDVIFNI